MKIFIVTMRRWGEDEGHQYIIGVYTDLAEAYIEGTIHSSYRAGKYEPYIQECVVDKNDRLLEISNNTALAFAKMKFPEKFDDKSRLKEEVDE